MNKAMLKIKESEINKNLKNAFSLLNNFSHTEKEDGKVAPSERNYFSTAAGAGFNSKTHKVNLIEAIRSADEQNPLETKTQHTLISAIHRGISIANVIAEKFEENSELKNLLKEKASGNLSTEKVSKFNELNETRSVITVFVTASFVIEQIKDLAVSDSPIEINLPKIDTSNPLAAIKGALFGFFNTVSGKSINDTQLASIALNYFSLLAEQMINLTHRLQSTGSFDSFSYEVSSDSFVVSGFELNTSVKTADFEMDVVEPNQVIGNAVAKHQAMRLAHMLMCYDFEKKLNPFVELGGHIFTFLGDGKPGTGKTTVIKMMATLLKRYCDVAGYTFYYENFGTDNIDSYQGKSGQKTREFINNVTNPKVIGFGTIDDIDQVAGKRGDKSYSAGQQEVTAVLMDAFAGATTTIRGNCTFGMFSNFPENVDDALRQRAGARYIIDGPKTHEDFVDIFALLIGKNHNIPTGDFELYASQEIKKAVKEGYEKHNLPEEKKLLEIYNETVLEVGQLNDFTKIGKYLKNIQAIFPKLAGRDMKNITDSIKIRSMDFDMPEEWFEDASLFMHKSYDEKLSMITELREEISIEMTIQEINRYVDSEFRYMSKSDNAALDSMVRNMNLQKQALEICK